MRTTAIARTLALGMLCWIGASLPAYAQAVGAIGGTVTDASGAVLPGATLALTSPGLIGTGQTTVADGQGNYQFTRLVPGRYSVKGELEGFQSTIQENVDVNADRTSRVDLKLVLGSLRESVTVSGEAPLLDTTSALQQTELTRQVLDSLPVGNDIWSISRLSPGVLTGNYDVGGRGMIVQQTNTVHGSGASERAYLFDGMDNNSYHGSLSFYPNTFAFQEINFQGGEAPAESSVSGVVINLITKTGTNAFHGSGMFQGTNSHLESNNVTDPTLRAQLLKGVPALVLAQNPDIRLGSPIEHLFDSAITLGGPIQRDRIWFFVSGQLGQVYQRQVGSYNADGTELLNDNQLNTFIGKLSWAVNSSSQLHYSYGWTLKDRFHVTSNATQFYDTEATVLNASKMQLHSARWSSVLSSKLLFEVAGLASGGDSWGGPQAQVQQGDIPRFDSVTQVNSVAQGSYTGANGWRTNLAASLNYAAGKHDVKAGWQYINNSDNVPTLSWSDYPAGLQAIYSNGVPVSVKTFNSPTLYNRHTREEALYVQDKWRPAHKLTLNLGLRFATMYGWLNDGTSPLCQVQTVYIAGQCFPAVKGVPDFKSVVPRFALVYDLFGNGRTALKFSANRYVVPSMSTDTGGSFLDNVNPIRSTNDTRSWTVCKAGQTSGCDLNGDKIPQLNELGPSTGFNLGSTNHYADNLKWPYTNEFAVNIERELPGAVVVSAGYFYRKNGNQIGSTNLAVPASTYAPLQVTDVVSGQMVTVYNQASTTLAQFNNLWSNLPQLDATFKGADFTLEKRLSHRWSAIGSLSLGKSDINIYGTVDQNNPNNSFFTRGPNPLDVPVSLKISGTYELPYQFSIGASEQFYDGWPITNTVLINSASAKLTQVTQSIIVAPRGTTRLPSVNLVDFDIRRTYRIGGMKLEPRLDVFNLFNASAITAQVSQLGPTYGNATTLLGARLIKLGANVSW
jgi:hypothetical protein